MRQLIIDEILSAFLYDGDKFEKITYPFSDKTSMPIKQVNFLVMSDEDLLKYYVHIAIIYNLPMIMNSVGNKIIDKMEELNES